MLAEKGKFLIEFFLLVFSVILLMFSDHIIICCEEIKSFFFQYEKPIYKIGDLILYNNIPYEVDFYFHDGKCLRYIVKPIFSPELNDIHIFSLKQMKQYTQLIPKHSAAYVLYANKK